MENMNYLRNNLGKCCKRYNTNVMEKNAKIRRKKKHFYVYYEYKDVHKTAPNCDCFSQKQTHIAVAWHAATFSCSCKVTQQIHTEMLYKGEMKGNNIYNQLFCRTHKQIFVVFITFFTLPPQTFLFFSLIFRQVPLKHKTSSTYFHVAEKGMFLLLFFFLVKGEGIKVPPLATYTGKTQHKKGGYDLFE